MSGKGEGLMATHPRRPSEPEVNCAVLIETWPESSRAALRAPASSRFNKGPRCHGHCKVSNSTSEWLLVGRNRWS